MERFRLLKLFALSQFVLPASLVSVPLDIIKRIERILYHFLWGGKDKVKRKKITQELKDGGIKHGRYRKVYLGLLKQYGYRGFSSPTPVFTVGFN